MTDEIKNIDEQKPKPPDTTVQEDLTHAGQRRVNLIWEFTQGIIAIAITAATIYCAVNKIESDIISYAFFLVISIYFIRTNHQLIGGVGAKPLNQHR